MWSEMLFEAPPLSPHALTPTAIQLTPDTTWAVGVTLYVLIGLTGTAAFL